MHSECYQYIFLPFSIDAHAIYIWDPNGIMMVPLVIFATLIQNALQNSV